MLLLLVSRLNRVGNSYWAFEVWWRTNWCFWNLISVSGMFTVLKIMILMVVLRRDCVSLCFMRNRISEDWSFNWKLNLKHHWDPIGDVNFCVTVVTMWSFVLVFVVWWWTPFVCLKTNFPSRTDLCPETFMFCELIPV